MPRSKICNDRCEAKEMKFLGIDIAIKHLPQLDVSFLPLGAFFEGYLKEAKKPVSFAVTRPGGAVSVYDTFIHDRPGSEEADKFYASRLVKLLLWVYGGVEIAVCGDEKIAQQIRQEYSQTGARAFDAAFMTRVYERPFAAVYLPISQKPAASERAMPAGGNFDGCRIGFDAGGSDRKVSAVIDGKVVYSEEVVWHPKTSDNPDYHLAGILEAFRTAASKMPRVDAIGVSSAGIYVDNRTMVASLFLNVPQPLFEQKGKSIYPDAAREMGDLPLVVANDGDVAALAGAMELGEGRVLGIAMGTSQAAGYVDGEKKIAGWLNELAFAPVDCNPAAMRDEWSGDLGCGVKYFSQDAVIKLAGMAGIELADDLTPAQKLKAVQDLAEADDRRAAAVFCDIGVYLGHTINLYARFYDLKNILLLGRVMSGKGGTLIARRAQNVLDEEYPHLAKRVRLVLPDEKSRRVGQSVAAAGLPVIEKLRA